MMEEMERDIGLKPKLLNYYDDQEEENATDLLKDANLFMVTFQKGYNNIRKKQKDHINRIKTDHFKYTNKLAAQRPNTASKAYEDMSKRFKDVKIRSVMRK